MQNIIRILILIIAVMSQAPSQHITNTLGTTGLFRIKDGVNTYFTLTQSNGYVDITKSFKLVNTTDLNTGVIYKGADRFIHDYKPPSNAGENTFMGLISGNFSMGGATFGFGSRNSGFGYGTLTANTTGWSNSAFGDRALYANTSGKENAGFGTYSLYANTTGQNNSAFGSGTMFSNISGYNNTAIGFASMYYNTTGFNNTAIGVQSLYNNTSGGENTALGRFALHGNTTGYNNTGVGTLAISNVTTGTHITALGYTAGSDVTTGFNLTLIGYGAEPSSGGTWNQITLGNFQVSSLRCNVQNITSLSDARDKKNIEDLNIGLEFISSLKPRMFYWDRRDWYENSISDGSKMDSVPTAGFIAQELDDAQYKYNAEWLRLVMKDNPEKLEATYGNLLPVMVKAIQELKEENDKLKKEIESMRSIADRLTMLELTVLKDAVLKEIKSAEK